MCLLLLLLLFRSFKFFLRPFPALNRGVYRSLEGTGDLANSFLYQYPTVQLENYHKDYRSVQKRLSRRMEKRDALNRAGGSASRWVGRKTLSSTLVYSEVCFLHDFLVFFSLLYLLC